jgi:T5SS/PEP-CTERM-associated repeat protein
MGSFTTIGGGGAGFVDILSGGVWSTDGTATLSGAALSTARVNVSGTGSRWDNSGRLSIGTLGTATLHVSGGADVTSTGTTTIAANGEAFVRVEGAGSSLVVFGTCSIGSGGTATFDVLDGAFLQTRDATVGAGSNNTAVVTVSGQNSNWTITDNGTARNLTIGGSGTLAAAATLNIINGGDVICGQSSLRHGTAIVDGDSSRWISSQSLGIGDTSGNPGSLTIRAGGRVESSSGGLFSGAVEISGANSAWVMTGDLSIGAVSSASLQIHSAGSVQSANALIASSTGTSSIGTVTVQAGTWSNSGSVFVGGNFAQAGGHGSLNISPGGFVAIADSLVIWNNGTVTLAGGQLKLGSIDFRGSTFNFNAGTLRFTDVVNLDAFFVDKLLGASRTLGPNRSLIIDSTPTLSSLLILGGGSLTVPQLAVGSPLQFDSGTFNLTSANLTIGNTGLFGNTVVLDTRNINVTNSTNIQPGGRLFMLGGHFSSGGGITNNGEIIVNSPFTANFVNPITNNAEIRVATGASAHFFDDVTGAGSITGGGAKVFEPGASSSASRITGGGSTIVRAGASLSVDVIRESSLLAEGSVQIRPSAENSRVGALTIPAGGRLDLTSNTLIGDYAGASPFNSIRALLASGFANGSWNGAGINSSVAAVTPNRAIGYTEAADIGFPATFAGEPIDSTTLLIRFTLPGDANLDRLVNIGDFSLLAANFNSGTTWVSGDFNYDGVTAIGDFALLAANFNQSLPVGAARAAIPEPATLSTIIASSLTALRRRGRHQSHI